MKKQYLLFILLNAFSLFAAAQNYWTGIGGDGLWGTGTNWTTGVPLNTDNVVIDNLHGAAGNFNVTLPSGVVTTTVSTLQITPTAGNLITLLLPSTNTAQPGLTVTGAGDCFIINDGGTFRNSSTAASASFSLTGTFRINNGGKYWHSSTAVILTSTMTKLSTAVGTEYGIFEIDKIGGISLLTGLGGSTFGTLAFSAVSNGGTRTYSGSSTSDLTIRGDFLVNTGVTYNCGLEGNIVIAGNLTINGTINWGPSVGPTKRSFLFNGTSNQIISGSGTLTLGADFRNIEVTAGATVFLNKSISLPNAGNSVVINADGNLQTNTSNIISGVGTFTQNSKGLLGIVSPTGITAAPTASGPIQTTTRNFSSGGKYEYNGAVAQFTGDGVPSSVGNLIINNSMNETVTLTNSINIDNELSLQKGFLTTTSLSFPTLRDTTTISSSNSDYFNYGVSNIGWKNSFINGPMNYDISTTSKKWFTTGKISGTDTLFAPVALDKFNTTPATYTSEYFPAAHFDFANLQNPPLHGISELEFWNINCSALATPDKDAKVTLTWRPHSKVGDGNPVNDAAALADLAIAHYYDDGNGNKWRLDDNNPVFIPTGSPADYGFISTSSHFTSTFTTPAFTLGTKSIFNILPVRFLHFNATRQGKNINIQWQTKEEQGIDHYDVEKSMDGIIFKKIVSTKALNNYTLNNYIATDLLPNNDSSFYRLKITDAQHKSIFSNIIKVNAGKTNAIIIYPNPVTDELRVNLPASESRYTISIVNTSGQIVKTITSATQNLIVNVTSLTKGTYFLYIHNDLGIFSQQFTKH